MPVLAFDNDLSPHLMFRCHKLLTSLCWEASAMMTSKMHTQLWQNKVCKMSLLVEMRYIPHRIGIPSSNLMLPDGEDWRETRHLHG